MKTQKFVLDFTGLFALSLCGFVFLATNASLSTLFPLSTGVFNWWKFCPLSPRGYLAMLGDWVEAKDATKDLAMHSTAPPKNRIIALKYQQHHCYESLDYRDSNPLAYS